MDQKEGTAANCVRAAQADEFIGLQQGVEKLTAHSRIRSTPRSGNANCDEFQSSAPAKLSGSLRQVRLAQRPSMIEQLAERNDSVHEPMHSVHRYRNLACQSLTHRLVKASRGRRSAALEWQAEPEQRICTFGHFNDASLLGDLRKLDQYNKHSRSRNCLTNRTI